MSIVHTDRARVDTGPPPNQQAVRETLGRYLEDWDRGRILACAAHRRRLRALTGVDFHPASRPGRRRRLAGQ